MLELDEEIPKFLDQRRQRPQMQLRCPNPTPKSAFPTAQTTSIQIPSTPLKPTRSRSSARPPSHNVRFCRSSPNHVPKFCCNCNERNQTPKSPHLHRKNLLKNSPFSIDYSLQSLGPHSGRNCGRSGQFHLNERDCGEGEKEVVDRLLGKTKI